MPRVEQSQPYLSSRHNHNRLLHFACTRPAPLWNLPQHLCQHLPQHLSTVAPALASAQQQTPATYDEMSDEMKKMLTICTSSLHHNSPTRTAAIAQLVPAQPTPGSPHVCHRAECFSFRALHIKPPTTSNHRHFQAELAPTQCFASWQGIVCARRNVFTEVNLNRVSDSDQTLKH